MISRGGASARGGKIRPPRRIIRNGSVEGSDFDVSWDMLEQALRDIHNKTCSRLSFEELYRAAYKIVIKKKGSLLYDRVKQFEEQWFTQHITPKIGQLVTKNLISMSVDRTGSSVNERRQTGEKFLKGLRDTWEDHNTSMNMAADILMYLDRGFTQIEASRVPIFAATIALFRQYILRSSISGAGTGANFFVLDLLIAVMLDQIDMEREGDVIDRTLIRSCSRMLNGCFETEEENESERLYLTVFEPRFLQNSETFYAQECERLLRESDASTWLRHTQRRLQEEESRCDTTIELETLQKVQSVIDKELISKRLNDFLAMEGSGLAWMIDNDKVEDLAILYQLISRVDETKSALRSIMQRKVVESGREIERALHNTDNATPADGAGEDAADTEKTKAPNPVNQQTALAIKWVDDVLRLKDKFDMLLERCFQEDLIIQSALTKSFSDFINEFNRCSEYVSLFIDDNLKRGIKGKTEAEVDVILEKAVVLIRYLQDRDMFQTYYQRHLARRLLHAKSESHDVEKQIISRMKQELGQQFTSKFEGMFRDLGTSTDLTRQYRDYISSTANDGDKPVDLNISVLTTNYWPPEVMGRSTQVGDASRVTCNYPRDIERLQKSFEQFYLKERNGRKLTWIGTTGSADVKCLFPAIPGKAGALAKERRYELNVPTFAMVVLLLFNDLAEGESLSFAEIQGKTGISTMDLMRALTAIAVAPKSRVLTKEPASKSIKSGDKFTFNSAFQSKTVRIKAPIINAVSKVEDKDERKRTEEKNDMTRAHIIDAAIVRIMKSRKELAHTQLVSEVISQLTGRFKPDVSLIKARIEDLIGRDYLERPEDEDAPGLYRYVA